MCDLESRAIDFPTAVRELLVSECTASRGGYYTPSSTRAHISAAECESRRGGPCLPAAWAHGTSGLWWLPGAQLGPVGLIMCSPLTVLTASWPLASSPGV